MELRGIKQQGERGAGVKQKHGTTSRPRQNTMIKRKFEKKLFSLPAPRYDSSGKTPTYGHGEQHKNWGVFRNKKHSGVRSRP